MTNLEHRIPPPVIGVLMALAMWGVAQWPPALALPGGVRPVLALLLALAGLAFDVLGVWTFWRWKTTVNPMRPANASTLVDSGIYRFTRNPMYVGMALLLTAWAVQLGALWPFAGPVLFIAYIQRFQIVPEERALAARFGSAYTDYQQRVRRWL